MSIQPDNKIVLAGDMFGQVLARLNNPVVLSNNDFSKNEEKINIIPNPFIFNAELSFEIDKSGKIAVDLCFPNLRTIFCFPDLRTIFCFPNLRTTQSVQLC